MAPPRSNGTTGAGKSLLKALSARCGSRHGGTQPVPQAATACPGCPPPGCPRRVPELLQESPSRGGGSCSPPPPGQAPGTRAPQRLTRVKQTAQFRLGTRHARKRRSLLSASVRHVTCSSVTLSNTLAQNGQGTFGPPIAHAQQVRRPALRAGFLPRRDVPTSLYLFQKEKGRTDGSFVVHDIPSGSYVVEVISPAHKFEPVRVDITSKGKMRARYVNYIKTSEVVRLPYPLQMKSSGPPSYFIKRESWGWTDFLMNPMVMMMVLPLLIFVLLPKVVNTSDPDMRREMEQSMNMLNSNHELPDVSEFMTRLFSSKSSSKSGSGSSKAGKSGAGKRR
nr:PREDICTED: ER membrane protein complex subunit 7 [Apteryx mantelli mantelli]